ncbi:Bacterial capsule synthesis protein [Frankia canadensis]|uniref:Bacterial capsule synthesis protein n=1 Tax=Frankia canadensis TaxID=1836972 RepID=A0A2I2KUE6_9ACTN|nr:CapA family protein [Frankia canadensis]SNQ49281.1 Bacterial capsule synthesis protein [Frankia canadensis]SOU56571.1 Bacterial capsule synthesis protein [Frankia canadensis]
MRRFSVPRARPSSPRAALGVAGALVAGLVACSVPYGDDKDQAGRASGSATPTGRVAAAADASTAATRPAGAGAGQDGPRRPTGTPVTIAFGGDIHFAGSPGARLAADPATAIGPMAATLSAADLAIANLETAVTTGGTPAPKEYTFRAPPTAFDALRAAGIDVVTMANNHGMDYGLEGLRDSLRGASAAHYPVIGIGEDDTRAFTPYRTTVKGQRIAVVGATQVLDDELAAAWTAGPHKPGLASAKQVDRLVAAVRAARSGADTVIVFLHWGTEQQQCPTDTQRSLVPLLAAAGADVVVGSHAHVLLGGGWADSGVYVDYGLGNFVFYSSGNGPNTASGVLRLTVAGRAVTDATWVPARIVGGAPRPLTGAAAGQALGGWNALRGCTGLSDTPPR